MTISQQLYDQINQIDLKKTRRSKIDHLQQEILFLRQWLNYCQIQSWLKKKKTLKYPYHNWLIALTIDG